MSGGVRAGVLGAGAALALAACGSAGTPGLVSASCAGHAAPTGVNDRAPSPAILAALGVLRRRGATIPGDLLADAERGAQVFVRYARRALVSGGQTYYLVPEVTDDSVTCHRQQDVLLIVATPSAGDAFDTLPLVAIEAAHPDITMGNGHGQTTIELVVPDRIGSVSARCPAGKAGGFSRRTVPAATVTAHAVGNVVALSVPRSGAQLRRCALS